MKCERGIGFLALIFSILVIGVFAFSIYLIRLDNIIRNKFESQRWDIPKGICPSIRNLCECAILRKFFKTKSWSYIKYCNYEKSGSYVIQGNQMYVHTRGLTTVINEPEQVLEISINGQVGEIRSTKPSSTGIARLEPLLIGGIYPQHNEDRVSLN